MASMHKTISKNGVTSWHITFELGTDPVTGKRQRIFRTIKGTKKEATAFMDRMKVEIERGYYYDPSNMKLEDWMNQWIEYHVPNIEATTRTRYKNMMKTHIIPRFGSVPLRNLRTNDIQMWVNELHTKNKLAPKSVRNIYLNLKAALSRAVILRMIPYNPCDGIILPKAVRYKAEIYTVDEMNKLLDLARDTDIFVPVLLATKLGLRRGEILGLRWDHIDFDSAIVHINESRVITEDGVLTKAPKSAAGVRDISIGQNVLKDLKYVLAKYNWNKRTKGKEFSDSGYVFSQENGCAYRPESLTRMWARFLKKHDLKRIRFHDLRHSCATAMLEAGIDAKTVQNRLGHADISMTLNVYAHCTPSMDRNAAQKLDDLFTGAV